MKILILGGYGVFGGRLAHLLRDLSQITLLVAGRDEVRAQQFCAGFEGKAAVVPVRLDRREIAEGLVTNETVDAPPVEEDIEDELIIALGEELADLQSEQPL